MKTNREYQNSDLLFKNIPVDRNKITKWTKLSVQKAGLDIEMFKFANHSHRATAFSYGKRKPVNVKTGHGNVSSMKPYPQLDRVP